MKGHFYWVSMVNIKINENLRDVIMVGIGGKGVWLVMSGFWRLWYLGCKNTHIKGVIDLQRLWTTGRWSWLFLTAAANVRVDLTGLLVTTANISVGGCLGCPRVRVFIRPRGGGIRRCGAILVCFDRRFFVHLSLDLGIKIGSYKFYYKLLC